MIAQEAQTVLPLNVPPERGGIATYGGGTVPLLSLLPPLPPSGGCVGLGLGLGGGVVAGGGGGVYGFVLNVGRGFGTPGPLKRL